MPQTSEELIVDLQATTSMPSPAPLRGRPSPVIRHFLDAVEHERKGEEQRRVTPQLRRREIPFNLD